MTEKFSVYIMLFKFGHLNVRSLLNSFHDLKGFLVAGDFDLFAISESWLHPDISSDVLEIENYNFYRRDRASRGGGVGVYVKNNLNIKIMSTPAAASLEQLWFTVNLSGRLCAVCVIYRAPNVNLHDLIGTLDSVLSDIVPTVDAVILLGDLNIDFLAINSNSFSYFNNLLETYGLLQVVDQPTRITSQTQSLIDVIITNDPDLVQSVSVVDSGVNTDHFALACELCMSREKSPVKYVTYRDFRDFDNASFQQHLYSYDWDTICGLSDVNTMVEYFNRNLIELFNLHAPVRTVRVTRAPAPWMTSTIRDMIHTRDAALQRYRRTRNPVHGQYYAELRNYVTGAVRREKRAYLNCAVSKKNAKSTWSALSQLNIVNKCRKHLPNNFHYDIDDINKYFGNVGANGVGSSVAKTYISRYDRGSAFGPLFDFHTVNRDDILLYFDRIKSKAVGLDGISSEMLRLVILCLLDHITLIINKAITTHTFPDKWKEAVVLPLPKVSNPTGLSQLRPISILPTLSKILEMIMAAQISEFVQKNDIIPASQSGFRANHSTTTALWNISDDILKNIDEKKVSCLILLDYSKAFDTVDHLLLVKKLKYFGFSSCAAGFISNYLSHRTQCVRLGSDISQPLVIGRGVPQGSILGPLLFSIYISDFHTVIKQGKIHNYADDSQLLYTLPTTKTDASVSSINEDLSRLAQISLEHKLTLNASKSQIILFGSKRNLATFTNDLEIAIDKKALPIVTEAKNLGIWLDSELRFTKHVNMLCQASYSILKQLYPSRHIMDTKLKLKVCESLILSKIAYGDVVYGPNLKYEDTYRVQKIFNSCLRLCYGIRKFDHISHKYDEAGWLKFEGLLQLHINTLVHKTLLIREPEYLFEKLKFLSNPDSERSSRSVGRLLLIPRHRSTCFRRSFSYMAPKLYNSLAPRFYNFSLVNFKKKLKTHILNTSSGFSS